MFKSTTITLVILSVLLGQFAWAQHQEIPSVTAEMLLLENAADIMDKAQFNPKTGQIDAASKLRLMETRNRYLAAATYDRATAVNNLKQAAVAMGVSSVQFDEALKTASTETNLESALPKAFQAMHQPAGARFSGLTVLKVVGVLALAFALAMGAAFGD